MSSDINTHKMDTEHDTTDMMSKEAIAFGEWVSRCCVPALLRARRRPSETRARALTLLRNMEVEDVVVATTDYTAAADDEVSLKAGDIVEVLDTKTALGSKYRGRVYRYENHFFQSRGPGSLDYVFSVPTYKMYYY